MPHTPQLSLIMAVYNGEEHLAEAMDSILAQSFVDFECIVVDDASTDATPRILAQYAAQDPRVRILRNDINRERSYSRNRAVETARAPLIAVADADDWLHPERLRRQYDFMQQHPNVAVCGSWISVYETDHLWQWPVSDAEIHAHMLFNSPIAHPTATFRKDVWLRLAGGYDETCPLVEDYDLWERFSRLGVAFANIPEALLRYRLYPEKDRSTYRMQQVEKANIVRLRQIRLLGLEPTESERICHTILSGAEEPYSLRDVLGARAWGQKLLAANLERKVYDHSVLSELLRTLQKGMVCRWVWHRGRSCWRKFMPQWLQCAYRRVKFLLRGI